MWRLLSRRRRRAVRAQIARYYTVHHVREGMRRYRGPDEAGQALVEYALVLVLLTLVCVVALQGLGIDFGSVLNTITSEV